MMEECYDSSDSEANEIYAERSKSRSGRGDGYAMLRIHFHVGLNQVDSSSK